jgi:hypothetical protein
MRQRAGADPQAAAAGGQGYVLRVPSNFHLTLAAVVRLSCKEAAARLHASDRRWEVRSAGKGSKGGRWYAWAWLGTASPRHYLLIRRHLATGELAFHYCYVPDGQPVSLARLIRAAGCRWPVEECFEHGKQVLGWTAPRSATRAPPTGGPGSSSRPTLSSASPGRWLMTCACPGNAPPYQGGSPRRASAGGLAPSARPSLARPVRPNPANPAPDGRQDQRTAAPHPTTTWGKPPEENALSRAGANVQVKRQAKDL